MRLAEYAQDYLDDLLPEEGKTAVADTMETMSALKLTGITTPTTDDEQMDLRMVALADLKQAFERSGF